MGRVFLGGNLMSKIMLNGVEYNSKKKREAIYSIDQSQGEVWINSGIAVADIEEFLFVNSNNGVEDYAHTVKTSDIPVYTGGSDVYMTIFPRVSIGWDFNIRIYNGDLYVSFERVGSNTKEVSVYIGNFDL